MDDLIAQDADLIDSPLQAAVRELLTDDSMEHLETFTHNLVQAFDRHGLKAVSTDYLDNLHDTVRGLRQDIKAEQKHTDTSRSGDLVERLRYTAEHGIFTAHDNGMQALPDEAAAHIEALEAENERLRAALREIIAYSQRHIDDTDAYTMSQHKIQAARAALETKHD